MSDAKPCAPVHRKQPPPGTTLHWHEHGSRSMITAAGNWVCLRSGDQHLRLAGKKELFGFKHVLENFYCQTQAYSRGEAQWRGYCLDYDSLLNRDQAEIHGNGLRLQFRPQQLFDLYRWLDILNDNSLTELLQVTKAGRRSLSITVNTAGEMKSFKVARERAGRLSAELLALCGAGGLPEDAMALKTFNGFGYAMTFTVNDSCGFWLQLGEKTFFTPRSEIARLALQLAAIHKEDLSCAQ